MSLKDSKIPSLADKLYGEDEVEVAPAKESKGRKLFGKKKEEEK